MSSTKGQHLLESMKKSRQYKGFGQKKNCQGKEILQYCYT